MAFTSADKREVLDFFLAGTLDRSLAETGVLDFKFKFVLVAACRTRIDSDIYMLSELFWAAGRRKFCFL